MTNVHNGPDGQPHVFLMVTRVDGSHSEVQLPDDDQYTSAGAKLLRTVTATQRVVWSPETGWTS